MIGRPSPVTGSLQPPSCLPECGQAPTPMEDGIMTLHPRPATVRIRATLVVRRPEPPK